MARSPVTEGADHERTHSRQSAAAPGCAAAHHRAVGPEHRPRADQLHHHPRQVAHVCARLGAARPYRHRAAQRCGLGGGAEGGRADAGSDSAAGAHAGHLLRGGRHGREGLDQPHGADVRPPRQAARVRRLAQRSGPLEAQIRGRQALWPWRSRRRLCGLCQRGGDSGAQAPERAPSAHRGHHRDLRGKRLGRSAALCGCLAPASGRCGPGDLSRQRCRQLRPAVADHQPARHGQRHAQGADPHRGCALGRCLGRGAFVLSHHASGAGPSRGQQERPRAAAELSLRGAGRAHGADPRHGGDPRRGCLCALSLGALRLRRLGPCVPAHDYRSRPGSGAPHLGAHAERDRCGGHAQSAKCRQCAAPLHGLQAQPAPAAAGRCRSLRAGDEGPAGGQRAL